MEQEDGMNLLNKVGNKSTKLAEGNDSEIFRVTNTRKEIDGVAKEYSRPRFYSIDNKDKEKVLKQYYIDTNKAIDVVKNEPELFDQSITINHEEYKIIWDIKPQGSIILRERKENEGGRIVQTSFGQDFINGHNLDFLTETIDFQTEVSISPSQKIFLKNLKICDNLQDICQDFFKKLSEKLNIPFRFAMVNVLPFVDKENKTMTVVITDLVADLKKYYDAHREFEDRQ